MPREIRQARSDDLVAVATVIRGAFAPWTSRIGREPAPMAVDYRALIADGRVSVIGHEGSVQGVLVLIPQGDAMLLDVIAVAPDAQGAGLGQALLAFAEMAARAAGCQEIRLYTNEAMAGNVRLYLRHGYAETHRAEEEGLRRVYMAKPLPPGPRGPPG